VQTLAVMSGADLENRHAMAVDALRVHRTRQVEERLAAGAPCSDGDLVFATLTGGALDEANVRREFKAACRAAKIGDDWTPRKTAALLRVPHVQFAGNRRGDRATGWPLQHLDHRGGLRVGAAVSSDLRSRGDGQALPEPTGSDGFHTGGAAIILWVTGPSAAVSTALRA
jgi:hypothetical protein